MELKRYLLETMSTRGINHFIFVLYSNALATSILLPSSFLTNRTTRPPLSFSLLVKFFLLGLVGITIMQNCVFTGISYSSPTLESAMSNLTPAITFVLAVIFRMEKLDVGSSISQIKMKKPATGSLEVSFYSLPLYLFPYGILLRQQFLEDIHLS
ncbi:unnamed protein product [Vicia faba]|uniref:WAT1-related protein n=1 Tax=Vicia faba TaxID=3906 RepID=A0AAV0YXR1_VICFA|nr:unnamed protein product [Vicia faba]